MSHIHQHSDWLYQSDIGVIRDREDEAHGITSIIGVNENNERFFPVCANSRNYFWCAFNDPGETLTGEKLKAILDYAATFKSGKVLVHCMGGANRSSIISAFLLHEIGGLSVEDAVKTVKGNNPHCQVRPELINRVEELTGDRYQF